MNIEFPESPKAEAWNESHMFTVHTPKNSLKATVDLLNAQTWVNDAYKSIIGITVETSHAYEMTKEQTIEALMKLCQHALTIEANERYKPVIVSVGYYIEFETKTGDAKVFVLDDIEYTTAEDAIRAANERMPDRVTRIVALETIKRLVHPEEK